MQKVSLLAAFLFFFIAQGVSASCQNATIIDSDNDSFNCYLDCNDTNPFIFPSNSNYFCDCDNVTFGSGEGTRELCADGYDNNCDGQVDEADCFGCNITQAEWSTTKTEEGETVYLGLKTSDCIEKILHIGIYSYANNTTEGLISNQTIPLFNNSLEIEWQVLWNPNATGNMTQYFFIATIDSFSKTSGLIDISKKQACVENWTCGSWDPCVSNKRYRTCKENNLCGTGLEKPAEEESCQGGSCSNNQKDSGEQGIDCGGICSYGREAICDDGKDNDHDCAVDCDDPDCKNDVACGGQAFILEDSDGDGLTDEQEIIRGTHILLDDTDRDGMSDKEDALPLCPNEVCNSLYGETEQNCPEDCKEKRALWPFILIPLLLIIGVLAAYILLKKPFRKKPPFKKKEDFEKLRTYIEQQLTKKIPLEKLIKALLEKKWKKEQIMYALKEAKKKAKKAEQKK